MAQKNSSKKTNRLSLGRLLHTYTWPFRKAIVLLIFLTLITNFIVTLQPIALSGVMHIIAGQLGTASPQAGTKLLDLNHLGSRVTGILLNYSHNKLNAIFILLAIYILIVILSTAFRYLAYLLGLSIETRAIKLMTVDLFKHLLSLNMDFFNHQKSGEIMSRFTNDIRATANGIGPLVGSLLHHSILIIVYSCYLFSTNISLTICAFFLILTQFALTEFIKRPIGRSIAVRLEKSGNFMNLLHEAFTSMRVIKLFGGEGYELNRVEEGVDDVVKGDIRVGLIKQGSEESRGILDSFAMAGIVLIAAQQLMKGTLALEGFALFIFVGQLLITPINKLAVNVSWTQALLASYARIDEMLKVEPNIADGHLAKSGFDKAIEINNLSFSYGHNLVLEDVSFEVKKGEIVAIVGPSGAGKSTLVDLILRFYDPEQGSISIDGLNLRELKFAEYRRLFGVVSQRNILFNDTVRNNIIYGRQSLGDKEVIEAAKIANAHDFILELPAGYDTLVGEKGVLLSGGQCQRLAIARAVVSQPQILILDEATSSLDSESEKQVQLAIDRVLENSTAIVIAHRLSTILHAHKIVVLQKGSIEAIARHEELLVKSPTYQVLYNLQFRDVRLNGEKILEGA